MLSSDPPRPLSAMLQDLQQEAQWYEDEIATLRQEVESQATVIAQLRQEVSALREQTDPPTATAPTLLASGWTFLTQKCYLSLLSG